MKKLIIILIAFFYFPACRKDNNIIHKNENLKTMSLPELKTLLNGKWQLQYSILNGYTGYIKYSGDSSLFFFYPVDSIIWIDKTETVFAVRSKIIYTWKKNSYNDSAYNLRFYDVIGYSFNWTPDSVINDTLVFVDNSRVGSSYYLTKKE